LARAFAIFEIADLDPEGHVHYPDLAAAMVQRYSFVKFPTGPDQFDEAKGINFEMGTWKDTAIAKIGIITAGLIVETANTDTSEALLEDALTWAAAEFRLTYKPEMLRRRAFVSQITFHSDAPLLMLNPIIEKVTNRLSKEIAANLDLALKYEPVGFAANYDKLLSGMTIAPFTLERREGVPFEDKKYFSSAPLRTQVHIELIEAIEKALTKH
jgi:hypothetical protein